MSTICNMFSETGATSSLFPNNDRMSEYLKSRGRQNIANSADSVSVHLKADKNAMHHQIIESKLSELEPHVNGPFTPDLARSLSEFKKAIEENGCQPF